MYCNHLIKCFHLRNKRCPHNYQDPFYLWKSIISSVQSLSCVWLCDTMDCSTPGFPVHHQLPELAQTHVHWVSDTIRPSHPLSYPSPPAFNLSQHQSLFQWISSSHQVAKVLEFQFQHQPGLISFRIDWLDLLAVQGTLRSSPTPQFKRINSSWLSFLYSPTHIHTWLLEKHSFDYMNLCWQSEVSAF